MYGTNGDRESKDNCVMQVHQEGSPLNLCVCVRILGQSQTVFYAGKGF